MLGLASVHHSVRTSQLVLEATKGRTLVAPDETANEILSVQLCLTGRAPEDDRMPLYMMKVHYCQVGQSKVWLAYAFGADGRVLFYSG